MTQVSQLLHIFPQMQNPERWVTAFDDAFDRFGIRSAAGKAGACAIWGNEVGGFIRGCPRESLNYQPARALAIFPKAQEHPEECEDRCAKGPQAFGNWIYADLYGNGPEWSGDGWKHRGGGINQLTFRSAYDAASIGIKLPALAIDTDLISQPEIAALVACWFMAKYKPASIPLLSSGTEADFLAGAALNGWSDESATQRRLDYWHRTMQVMDGDAPVPHEIEHRLLHQGVAPGDDVTYLEGILTKLGLYAGKIDRNFLPILKAGVIAFQKRTWPNNPYEWDGVVGKKTWQALEAFA